MGELGMSILQKIVKDFDKNLKPYIYKIELENGVILEFSFKKENLKHLLGLHKTSYNNFFSTLIYKNIKNGKITLKKLSKDKYFSDIEIRILNFSRIKDILNIQMGDEIIVFDKTKLKNCNLNSEYIIFDEETGETLHLGIAKGSHIYYPETWFIREGHSKDKYIENQFRIKVKKFKRIEK
jgi:hypothetical protein